MPAISADILDDGGAMATRDQIVVVNEGLRGDEELAIAILEKAVLGETVLDRVVLDQLKAYMHSAEHDGVVATNQHPSAGSHHDLDNLSVSVSSSDEGDKFEDACGDVGGHGDVASPTSADGSGQMESMSQLDRVVKHQKQHSAVIGDVPPMVRTPAEGLDAASAQAQAKLKDRPVTKGNHDRVLTGH